MLRDVWLPALVLAMLCVGLSQAALSPTYPDEIAYKVFLERYFINGGYKQSVTPYCDNFLAHPGWVLAPAAWFWSLISWLGSGPLSYRFAPILGCGVISGVLIHTNLIRQSKFFWPLLLLLIMGPAIYGLVLLRPEIIILTFCAILYALAEGMLATRRLTLLWFYALLAMLAYSFVVYVHPKALYLFMPAITIFILTSLNIRKGISRALFCIFFLCSVTLVTASAYHLLHQQFMECKSIPAIEQPEEQFMTSQAVNPVELLTNFRHFAEGLRQAFSGKFFDTAVKRLTYERAYQIDYLPPQEKLEWYAVLANSLLKAIFSGLLIYCVVKPYLCLRHLKEIRERRRLIITITLILALFVPYFLNLTKHFYEEAFFAGALLMASTLFASFQVETNKIWMNRIVPFVSGVMVITGALCLVTMYHNLTLPLMQGYEGPSLSYKTDERAIATEVNDALAERHIDPLAPLIVDDLTYDAVRTHPVLLTLTHLTLVGNVPGEVDTYAAKYAVKYGVVRCSYLEALKTNAAVDILMTLSYKAPTDKIIPEMRNICLFKLAHAGS